MTQPASPARTADSCTRRRWLRGCGLGLLGLSLPHYLALRGGAAGRPADGAGFGRARACVLMYCWGGVSQLETWDPKPQAPAEVRGEFNSIATPVPGVRVGEHMPRLARRLNQLAVVRSLHHSCTAHGKAMYWNRTGHPPPQPEVPANLRPSPHDWPDLGAQVARQRPARRDLPGSVQIPYPLVDNGTFQAGDTPGWLGNAYSPLTVSPQRGTPYAGVSRQPGDMALRLADEVDAARLQARRQLSRQVGHLPVDNAVVRGWGDFQERAAELLSNPRVRNTFDLDREPLSVRTRYGDHVCGQSLLLSRRLIEAGVPIVTVICAAGDLNGGGGDHWDTHSDNFPRLKNALLPPLDQGSSALLDDLAERGLLETTLLVWMTEFGRTPQMTGSGRNHYPFCYSAALAGGGIAGGQVYGRSDSQAAHPLDNPCGPADLQATILHALGIDLGTMLRDLQGRPLALSDGRPLPLFS